MNSRFSPSTGHKWLVAALGVMSAFVVLGELVAIQWSPLITEDHVGELAVHTEVLAHPDLRTAALAITDAGSPLSVDLILVVLAITLLATGRIRAAVYLVIARAVELGLETAVKYLVARPRPTLPDPITHARGFSFPSGHTGGTAVLCVAVLILAIPALRASVRAPFVVAGVGAIVAVAASRVLLGVHYPSDVLGGALLGTASALGPQGVSARRSRTETPAPAA